MDLAVTIMDDEIIKGIEDWLVLLVHLHDPIKDVLLKILHCSRYDGLLVDPKRLHSNIMKKHFEKVTSLKNDRKLTSDRYFLIFTPETNKDHFRKMTFSNRYDISLILLMIENCTKFFDCISQLRFIVPSSENEFDEETTLQPTLLPRMQRILDLPKRTVLKLGYKIQGSRLKSIDMDIKRDVLFQNSYCNTMSSIKDKFKEIIFGLDQESIYFKRIIALQRTIYRFQARISQKVALVLKQGVSGIYIQPINLENAIYSLKNEQNELIEIVNVIIHRNFLLFVEKFWTNSNIENRKKKVLSISGGRRASMSSIVVCEGEHIIKRVSLIIPKTDKELKALKPVVQILLMKAQRVTISYSVGTFLYPILKDLILKSQRYQILYENFYGHFYVRQFSFISNVYRESAAVTVLEAVAE